ncbi:MAG: hypothetical protein D6B26_03050, partial [Spirochaetaceae bacterium]
VYAIVDRQTLKGFFFWGRVPAAVGSDLAGIFLYWTGRKVSKGTGLLLLLLWALWPWAFSIGRTMREYAWYVPMAWTAILFLYVAVEKGFRKWQSWLLVLLSGAMVWHALKIDIHSTFKVVLIMVMAFVLWWLWDKKGVIVDYIKTKPLLLIPAGLGIIVLGKISLDLAMKSSHVSIVPDSINLMAFRYYFGTIDTHLMHLWRAHDPLFVSLPIFGIGVISVRKNKLAGLALVVTAVLYTFYSLFFDRYFRPRYTAYILPMYLFFMACGIRGVYQLVRHYVLPNRRALVSIAVTSIFVGLILFSPGVLAKTLMYKDHGHNKITGEFHFRVDRIMDYLHEHVAPGDAMLVAHLLHPIRLMPFDFDVPMGSYSWSSAGRFDSVARFMDKHPSGYMVLDDKRNIEWNKGFPLEAPFRFAGRLVTPVLRQDLATVYRWELWPQGDSSVKDVPDFSP